MAEENRLIMLPPQKSKFIRFAIEGLNSFATILYFNYLYFEMRARFGFSDRQNLELAAFIGLTYALVAWQVGKLAYRLGYFNTLKTGFGLMIFGLLLGAQLPFVAGQILAASIVNIGMCLTWPVLEALVSEAETPAAMPRTLGIYNVIWAATYALAFFIGGKLIALFGFAATFYLPALVQILQLALTFWLERQVRKMPKVNLENLSFVTSQISEIEPHRSSPQKTKTFLRMAWLANPFAYIAINTLIAVLPGVADKFHLTTALAGVVCSLWCFARVAAFVVLWQWPDWHYKFRWLAAAFVILILSFVTILLTTNLAVVLLAQLFFGGAIGLIYYSSLYYSMNASDVKSEHGGIHEAVIGLGNFVGPAIGAASLQFFPQSPHNGALAVSVLLCGGFGGLLWLRQPRKS